MGSQVDTARCGAVVIFAMVAKTRRDILILATYASMLAEGGEHPINRGLLARQLYSNLLDNIPQSYPVMWLVMPHAQVRVLMREGPRSS
jgi:hypothetical protein